VTSTGRWAWLTLLVAWHQGSAQAPGTVRGTVRDATGVPVAQARLELLGTPLGALTDGAGRYRISGAPAGNSTLRVTALAYFADSAVTTIPPGDSVVVDFVLRPRALSLAAIVVTASKRPQSLADVPASVSIVSDSDIARRAVTTVDEALDRAPGVQLLNGQINIRGSTGYVQGLGSRVLLLVDGVPINEGDRGGIDWDMIPVDNVARVEIVKGAGSSLYGSAALGGVVNLITRDIPDGLHARARFTAGAYADPPDSVWRFRNYTGFRGGADLAASFGGDRFRGAFSAGGRHSDGYRQQDQSDHWQLAGKGDWLADPVTTLEVTGAWSSNQFQVPLQWCVRGRCDDRGQSFQPFLVDTGDLGDHTRSDKGYLTATVTRTPDEHLTWIARASWLRTHFTDFQPGNNDFSIADRWGAEGRLITRPTLDQTVTVGGEVSESDVTSDFFHDHTQEQYAVYGEAERVAGTVRVTGGARIDFLAVDGVGLSAVVSPHLGVVLPSGSGIWRASVGRGFRAPSLAEQFVTTVVPPFTVVANPDLQPETAWTFEIGNAATVGDWLRTDAALFVTRAANLIEPAVIDTLLRIQFQNVQRAQLAGLDLSLAAQPFGPRFTTGLSYTYLDTRELAPASGPLAFRPRHLVTLSADYALGTVSVGADFRYSSRFERVDLYESDPRVAAQVLDLRAGWVVGPVEVRVLATNVLNHIYNLVPRTLEPVRAVTATVTYIY
jgi:outer membrane receptor for ferrienterochelin and colicins